MRYVLHVVHVHQLCKFTELLTGIVAIIHLKDPDCDEISEALDSCGHARIRFSPREPVSLLCANEMLIDEVGCEESGGMFFIVFFFPPRASSLILRLFRRNFLAVAAMITSRSTRPLASRQLAHLRIFCLARRLLKR